MEDLAIPTLATNEPWVRRLNVPNYPVRDAARYARITPQTIRSWQRLGDNRGRVAAHREKGDGLSYLQLIEVAVVAGARRAGVRLGTIRRARDYIAREFKSEFPFAQHEFATDGRHLLLKVFGEDADPGARKWLSADESGQFAWDTIIGFTLKSFEYERDIAVSWHVAGPESGIIIDPRVAFGAPNLRGLPTALLRDRWAAGEPLQETSEDFGIPVEDVREALQFEGVDLTAPQPNSWLH